MAFSIEPGIYLPGRHGARIEDIVVTTDDGIERLNTTTRELALAAVVWSGSMTAPRTDAEDASIAG